MQSLAHKRGCEQDKETGDKVNFTMTSLFTPQTNNTEGDTLSAVNPVLFGPVGEHRDEHKARRDGETFKVFGFAGGIFWDEGDGGIEAGETGEATADESSEEDGVEGSSKTDDECEKGRCDTK